MASGYYDITSKTLGKGHYGVVKLGRHCLTGEPVAIKIIEKSRLNPDSLNQLGTEIRILFRLSEYEHPNILKLYQTIDSEDKLYLVTEYCGPHACDLHDYLSRKHCRDGLGEIEAQVFFIQICSAISYCHSMGIVHRDLKPENILVTDYKHMDSNFFRNNKYSFGSKDHHDNNSHQHNYHQYPLLKLIDFGFANQWYPDEKMRTSCGTLAYSAPELLLGEPYDGTKVDVWGLGLMLYILLYGGNPFMQINDNETLTKILDCSFTTPKRDNVDYCAVELLRSLIKRNPDTRLPIDAILQHKWFANVPKTFETIWLKCQIKEDSGNTASLSTSSTTVASANATPTQQTKLPPQQNKLNPTQNVSSVLPSISEIGPLRSLNRSADDALKTDHSEQTLYKPNYSRTRSLSITRSHNRSNQQTPLSHTRSSMNLERLNSSNQLASSRGSSIYRPTSPDVGGSSIALTEEESQLHNCVIQEMFRLTKLIDSKSSIEASLKNARFTHRQFNQNSIQPAVLVKRRIGSNLVKLLGHKRSDITDSLALVSTSSGKSLKSETIESGPQLDKLGTINTKLRNDDYIYATYQLTRDRILRVRKEKLKAKISGKDYKCNNGSNSKSSGPAGQSSIIPKEIASAIDKVGKHSLHNDDKVSTKENDRSRMVNQRKLLQPQHKMRDKFTSFFRSGSTSPSASFSVSCDSQSSGDGSLRDQVNLLDAHHEAFNDHDNEHSANSGTRYYSNKKDTQENLMAYALPLARKCSLVSEESGCPNEPPENQS